MVEHRRRPQAAPRPAPALVDAVRGMLAFEQDVLGGHPRPRRLLADRADPRAGRHVRADDRRGALLLAVVERYPDLKSQANVLDLQDEIERLEAMIADRRELYNDQVFRYNTQISTVPTLVLAALFGWRTRPFFPPSRATPAAPGHGVVSESSRRSARSGWSGTARTEWSPSVSTPATPTSRSTRSASPRPARSPSAWPGHRSRSSDQPAVARDRAARGLDRRHRHRRRPARVGLRALEGARHPRSGRNPGLVDLDRAVAGRRDAG